MNLHLEPSITLILAPMFAGKTTELARILNIYNYMGLKVLYVNSIKDTRSNKCFSTHNPILQDIPFNGIKVSSLSEVKTEDYDVIGIDESQFFENLKHTVLDWVDNQKKIVIVAGLNGDYRREPFGEINDLTSHSETVIKLSSFCKLCKDNDNGIHVANFTKRIVKGDSQVLIGGSESYVPVCRSCFLK